MKVLESRSQGEDSVCIASFRGDKTEEDERNDVLTEKGPWLKLSRQLK